jgi:hypothetical protein
MTEPINEAGALLAWQNQMERKERKATTFDTLWYAACLEARARESVRDGLIASANDDRLEAATLLVKRLAEHAA